MTILRAIFLIAVIGITGAGCSKTTRVSETGASQPVRQQANTQQSATIATPQGMPVYTIEEIGSHATPTNCWIVIEDKVYDVTSYLSKNPNAKTLTEGCGKDAASLIARIQTEDPAFKDSLPDYELGLVAE